MILQECGGLFVYFYESGNVFHEKVVRDLEDLEDDMGGGLGDDSDPNVLDFVKIGEPGIDDDYGLEDLPALLYFAQGGTEIIQCISDIVDYYFKSCILSSCHVLRHIDMVQPSHKGSHVQDLLYLLYVL